MLVFLFFSVFLSVPVVSLGLASSVGALPRRATTKGPRPGIIGTVQWRPRLMQRGKRNAGKWESSFFRPSCRMEKLGRSARAAMKAVIQVVRSDARLGGSRR